MSKILVIRLSSFGDVAMLVPVVYSVAAKYPHERFVVLTRKAFAPLFENINFNVSVRTFNNHRHGSIFGLISLLFALTKRNYSAVADMHDVLRSKIIRIGLRLQGKKTARINKGRTEKREMIESKKLFPPVKSTIRRYQEVFKKIGFPAEITFTNFYEFRERSLYPLRSIVTEKKGKWIGIAPFAKHREKTYPLEKMGKVVESLAQNPEYTIFLFGTKSEEIVQKWKKDNNNIIETAGKLNLDTELLLMSYLDVMVSMDSANMHLASLVQTPVVSIWGATHSSLGFYGYKQDITNAIQADLDCRPCSVFGNLPCARGDYACLYKINEQTIIDKVEEVINKK